MEDDRREPGECVRPPALDDLALITAIDGDTDFDTIAHLHICPYCASRAREFRDLQRLLSKRLYRALCPSSDELVAFQQGWLESGRRAELHDHLSACPHCAADMRLLVEAASGPLLAPPTPMSRLRRIVAELLSPSPLAPLTSAYGALRGPSPGSQYTYRAENLQILLDIERAVRSPGRIVLFGLLLLENGLEGLSSASASLLCDDIVINSAMIDELGNFVLEDITPGDYSLSLRLPTCEVVVEVLSL